MEGKIHKCVFRIDKMKIQKKPYFTMLLIFLLIISTSILLYNGIGKSDTVEFTPFLYRELNESYLKNDWFVNVNDNTFNVRQNFIRLIKGILLIIPNIPLVYFLLYLATIFLVGISVYLISIHLFEKREIGILNMLLIFLGAPFSLGGNVLISDHLVSYGLSFAISLLGFYFLLKKRYSLFAIALGISTLIHISLGPLVFGILFLASYLTNLQQEKNFENHLKVFFIFFLFMILLSPIFLSQFTADSNLSGEKAIQILGYIRAPHHFLPFQWELTRYFEFSFFMILYFIAFKNSKIDTQQKKLIKIITVIIFSFFLISVVFSEFIPVSLIITLHLFRMSILLSFIAYLFIGDYFYEKIKESIKKKDARVLIFLILIISFLHNHLLLFSFPLFLIFKYLEYKNFKFKIPLKIVLTFILIFSIMILSLFPFYGNYLFSKLNIFTLILFKLIIMTPLFVFILFKKISKILIVFSLLISLLLFVLFNQSLLVYQNESNLQEMYNFIKVSTPNNAIFLTPINIPTFRLSAERAIVVDIKAFPLNERAMFEWVERISDVLRYKFEGKQGLTDSVVERYKTLSEEEILVLQEKYNFSYAVFEKPKDLDFEIIYENERYVVYKII